MRTLDPGNKPVARRTGWPVMQPAGQARVSSGVPGSTGFTLLELMVVISIIAIASAGVAFSMRDTGQASLDREGERLSALLETARALSRTSGQPLRWYNTAQGFRFEGINTAQLPQAWLNSQTAVIWDAAATHVLTLGPEPIIDTQGVTLMLDGRMVRVATDGLRPFSVQSVQAGQAGQ